MIAPPDVRIQEPSSLEPDHLFTQLFLWFSCHLHGFGMGSQTNYQPFSPFFPSAFRCLRITVKLKSWPCKVYAAKRWQYSENGKGQIALEIPRCKWKARKGTVHVSWKCFFSLRAGCTPAVTASWTQGMLSKVDHSRAALKFAVFKDYNGNSMIPEAKAIKRRSSVQPQRSQYWKADMKWMRKADTGKWHKGDQKHKAAGSQMAEKINTWFAHTSKMFLWQDILNYTREKFYMPLKKNQYAVLQIYFYPLVSVSSVSCLSDA